MTVWQQVLEVTTHGSGFTDITARLRSMVRQSGCQTGLCTVFVQHTSASLLIQENADPSVLRDLEDWFEELAPKKRHWEHSMEGPDDMSAHARCAVTRTSENIPICQGDLALGQWQGIYLWEHRQRGHIRHLMVHIMGES